MNEPGMPLVPAWIVFFSLMVILSSGGGLFWFYRRKAGLGRENAYLLAMGTLIAAGACGSFYVILHPDELYYGIICGFLIFLAVPVAVNLYVGGGAFASELSRAEPSADRQKVLEMLDAGKITAKEAAELLSTLGVSAKKFRLAPRQRVMSIYGSGLIALGFFLPWFKLNFAKEMSRAMDQIGLPGVAFLGQMISPATPQVASVSAMGGDISHGLGWVILSLGLIAGTFPMIVRQLDEVAHRIVQAVTLGCGSLLLLHLLTKNFRFASVGIVVVFLGYGVLWLSFWAGGKKSV